MSKFNVPGNSVRHPLRVGIVGMGGRSTCFANYFADNPSDGTVLALCDHIPEKGRFMAEHYQLKADVFDNVADMIRQASLDAVFITTPDFAHVEPATAALNANIHVFCEKPLATTLADCDAITAAAQRSSAVFYLGLNLRHGPVHDTIHELIATGRIGKVTTIEANEWYYEGRTYFRRWNRLRQYGGGLWVTKACHDFDLLNWMAGDDPTCVYAVANLSHYTEIPEAANQCRDCTLQFTCPDYYDVLNVGDTDDDVIRRLRLIAEENGQESGDLCLYNTDKDTFDNGIALITYANDIRATYTVNVLAARTTRQMRVVGTEGTIEADMGKGLICLTERHTHRTSRYDLRAQMASGHGGADHRLLKDFIHSVHTGRKPKTSWDEGRKSVELALAAQQSLETQGVVTL